MNKIPEKWYIRFGNEYQAEQVIIPYFKKHFPDKFQGNWRFTGADRYITNEGDYHSLLTDVPKDYTEITFKQFLEQVVNSPIPEKWCVRVTAENKSELQKTDKCGFSRGYDYTIGGYYSAVPSDWESKRFISIPEGYEEITFEQFKQFIAPDDYPVDFTVPGTPIPVIPNNTLFVLNFRPQQKIGWNGTHSYITKDKMVSFGIAEEATEYYGETYIKCERAEYQLGLHFCFPLSTLNKLSNQKSSEMKKIIGYKLVKETPDADAGTLIGVDGKYTSTRKDPDDDKPFFFPVSVLGNTEWFEPIYEQQKPKVGDIVKVTVPHTNEGKEGDIGKVIEVDDSKVPYKIEGYTFPGVSWVRDAVLPTEEEILAAKTVVLGEYTSKFEGGNVHFGCQAFGKEELLTIQRLLKGPIYATITIEDIGLTTDMVRRLLLNFE